MEKLLNNTFDDVLELKELLINSKEYKNYIKCLEQIKNDKIINDTINEIKKHQKEIVNYSSKNLDSKKLEIELELLNNELNSNIKYVNYINSAKELNILISKVQKEFNDYFDSLVS